MIGDPLSTTPDPAPFAPPPRRRGRMLAIVAALAFVIGLVAMYYLLPVLDRWRSDSQPVQAVQPVVQPTATAPVRTMTPADPGTVDALTARIAALDAQLRGVEGRMAAADSGSRIAAGQARRAEGLLIAFAARRALDRGLSLGYIDGQLRERFGTDQPQAVATIVAAAANPLTLADLREGLSRIGPTLTTGARHEGFLTTVWREITNLVVLRREDTPSPRPDDRLQRARTILDGGNVEGALAEVARMPGAADAGSWIDAAKRYIESRRALNTLELAAIGTPLPDAAPAPVAAPPPDTAAPNPAGVLPAN